MNNFHLFIDFNTTDLHGKPKTKTEIKIQFIYLYPTRQIIFRTINKNRNKDSICITFYLDLQQYHFDNSD